MTLTLVTDADMHVTRRGITEHDNLVVLVSEEVFAGLRQASREGWHEFVGWNDGHSAWVEHGTQVERWLDGINQAIIANPSSTDIERANAARGTCYAFITTPGHWDLTTSWWSHNGSYGGPHCPTDGCTVGGSFSKGYDPDRRYRFHG